MLEVELKFPLGDPAGFRRRLGELVAEEAVAVLQSDAYFNHPVRDFAETDEALRIRTVGDSSVVTFKGPKQGDPSLKQGAKTRLELELPLVDATADGWRELLVRLGFREVATVQKRRTPYRLKRDGRCFELSIDEVDGLGVFAEVETLAEAEGRDAAELAVVNLASALGLTQPEPRSYLEMVLGR